jgi:UDP-N-acetylmuramoyl-L-alanyl-D-glutamate--2,6-diaminopimelate ligase
VILNDILFKVAVDAVHGSIHNAVGKIEFDSRKLKANDVL